MTSQQIKTKILVYAFDHYLCPDCTGKFSDKVFEQFLKINIFIYTATIMVEATHQTMLFLKHIQK